MRNLRAVPMTVLGCALLVGALTGCGGDDGAGTEAAGGKPATQAPPLPVPKGFVRYAGAGFTVSHPEGWKVSTDRDDSGAQVVKIRDNDGPGKDGAELLIGRLPGFKGDFATRIVSFRSSAELAGRRIVAQRGMRLPGAAQAWRLDLTYPAPKAKDSKAKDGDPIRMEDLQVLGADRTLTEVAVRAPQDTFDRLALSRILPTFRLT